MKQRKGHERETAGKKSPFTCCKASLGIPALL